MDELKPTGFETADALDRLRAVRRGMPYKTLCPSDVDEAIEALEEKLNRRPAPENKPLTLEQLRKMDGERVWDDYNQDYALVWSRGNKVTLSFRNGGTANSEVGINRKIYARKPEKEEDHA